MNYLAIFPEELRGEREAVLSGGRALRALAIHELRSGVETAAFVYGGGRGKVFVRRAEPHEVVLELALHEAPLASVPFEAIVAVPRPQTVRKLLQLAGALGISALHLIRSENVVKSYLSSKRLDPSEISEDLLLGMEQSGASLPPAVAIHERFKPFVEDVLPRRITAGALCLAADTRAVGSLAAVALEAPDQKIFAALGPEAGWNSFEIDQFERLGFLPVSLGDRMLRVETAFTALFAQCQLLREQARRRAS